MKTKGIRLEAEFGPDARFELQPGTLRQAEEEEFERLKGKLLAVQIRDMGTKWEAPLTAAAGEAAALAWTTEHPSLVFPVLFEEKAAAAIFQNRRQARIFRKSRDLLAA